MQLALWSSLHAVQCMARAMERSQRYANVVKFSQSLLGTCNLKAV